MVARGGISCYNSPVMDRKIVFFDIDGTLVAPGGYIPPSTLAALEALHRRGHYALINTGRIWLEVEDVLRQLPVDGFVTGGGTCIRFHDQVCYHATLPHEAAVETAQTLYELGIQVFYQRDDRVFFDRRLLGDALAHRREAFGHLAGWVQDEDFSMDKCYCYAHHGYDHDRLAAMVQARFNRFEQGNQHDREFELVPLPHSKATGMARVLEMLGLTRDDCFAVGDSDNDLPMLEFAGQSIVMGSGAIFPPDAYVTDGILEDGIYHAMAHFGLID